MAEIFSKAISNEVSELERLLEETSRFLEANHRLQPNHAVELALEEMITNTIKYGYNDKNRHDIHVRLEIRSDSVHLTIIDDGREFNPLLAAPPDLSVPVEKRSIGGMGLHFVRHLAKSLDYQRLEGKNVSELVFAN